MNEQSEKDREPMQTEKPAYFNKHACVGCDAGYIECAQFAGVGLKCCSDCDHPTRWSDSDPYQRAQMREDHSNAGRTHRRCASCHGTGGDGGYAAGRYEFPCDACDGTGITERAARTES